MIKNTLFSQFKINKKIDNSKKQNIKKNKLYFENIFLKKLNQNHEVKNTNINKKIKTIEGISANVNNEIKKDIEKEEVIIGFDINFLTTKEKNIKKDLSLLIKRKKIKDIKKDFIILQKSNFKANKGVKVNKKEEHQNKFLEAKPKLDSNNLDLFKASKTDKKLDIEKDNILENKSKQNNTNHNFSFSEIQNNQNITKFKSNIDFKPIKTQFENAVYYMIKENKQKVIIKLNPQSLGKVNIKISVHQESKTKIEIKTEKLEALQILSEHQTQLKDIFSIIKKVDDIGNNNNISFSFNQEQQNKSNFSQNSGRNKKHHIYDDEKLNYFEEETMNNYIGLIEVIV